MYSYIEIECIVANALIELFEKQRSTEVSFDTVVKYGNTVANILEKQFGKDIILRISRKYQVSMLSTYSNLFDGSMLDSNNVIFSLKNPSRDTLEKLKELFRWTMSTNYIEAFISKEALKELSILI